MPKGFEILVDYLKREDALRETFFSRLNLMFFAAAGLSQHIWDELDRLAIQTLGCKVGMLGPPRPRPRRCSPRWRSPGPAWWVCRRAA